MANTNINTKGNTKNNKEEKKMKNELTYINAATNSWTSDAEAITKVNENKEEKKMTKDKHTPVIPEVAEPIKLSPDEALLASIRAEYEGENFDVSAQPEGSFVKAEGLGRHDVIVTSIETLVAKREANPDLDIEVKFSVRTKVNLEDEAPVTLYNSYILYENEEKQDIDIFYAYTNPSGRKGAYFTIKKDKKTLTKKADEISLTKDCDMHIIQKNQRIWSPLRDEYTKIRELLDVEELTWTAPIGGELKEIPSAGMDVAIYVYEDMPKEDAKARPVMDVKGNITMKAPEPFYKASFRAPEEHTIKVETERGHKVTVEKYENFTTDNSVSRLEEIGKLSGVINYFAHLPKRNDK